MSGRGGRGGKRKPGGAQSHLPSNLEALGVSPGDKLAPTQVHPPPVFPPMEKKPRPYVLTEKDKLILAKKEYLRQSYQESIFYLKKSTSNNTDFTIKRYSDRYRHNKLEVEGDSLKSLLQLGVPLWEKRLPKELHPKTTKSLKNKPEGGGEGVIRERLKFKDTSTVISNYTLNREQSNIEINTPLRQEVDESKEPVLVVEEEGLEEEEEEEEEEYDEEFEEEQGDYQLSYFETGDDALSDDEENGSNYY